MLDVYPPKSLLSLFKVEQGRHSVYNGLKNCLVILSLWLSMMVQDLITPQVIEKSFEVAKGGGHLWPACR